MPPKKAIPPYLGPVKQRKQVDLALAQEAFCAMMDAHGIERARELMLGLGVKDDVVARCMMALINSLPITNNGEAI